MRCEIIALILIIPVIFTIIVAYLFRSLEMAVVGTASAVPWKILSQNQAMIDDLSIRDDIAKYCPLEPLSLNSGAFSCSARNDFDAETRM